MIIKVGHRFRKPGKEESPHESAGYRAREGEMVEMLAGERLFGIPVDEVIDSLDVEGFLDFGVGRDEEVDDDEGCWEYGEEEIWAKLVQHSISNGEI